MLMRSKEATSAYRCSELGRLSLPFLLLLSLALLIPRLDGWDYAVGKYLWAEDGSVFINEAQRFGFASLWQPYQGYLHAYPRIVSYLSDFVDLSYRPIVLLLGWFIAYMFMICTLLLRSFSMGVSGLGVAIMFAAVVMQPNYGEVFFTLTNTQWFLAVGFAVILLAGEVGALKFTVFRLLGLLVLGLTGPFSVVILPVLALRAFYFKDLRTNAWIYGVTLICACVQVLVLLNSPRLSVNGGPIDWLNWSIVFVRMIFFGANTPLSWAAAVLLWIGVLLGIVRYWFAGGRDRDNAIQCLMLVVMGLLLIAACMYSAKSNLQSVLALGGGGIDTHGFRTL
ncbi:hypothetical protein TM7_0496 [candidate division TM7 genomosp. GTL1]|nr:hypothetical protein TM7_0496 [candidate division TM7 genomosp. GTL1]